MIKLSFLDKLNELNNVPKEVLDDFILAERILAGVNLFAILIWFLFVIIRLRKRKEEDYIKESVMEMYYSFFNIVFVVRIFFGIMSGQFHDYVLLFFSKQVYLVENFNISSCNW